MWSWIRGDSQCRIPSRTYASHDRISRCFPLFFALLFSVIWSFVHKIGWYREQSRDERREVTIGGLTSYILIISRQKKMKNEKKNYFCITFYWTIYIYIYFINENRTFRRCSSRKSERKHMNQLCSRN